MAEEKVTKLLSRASADSDFYELCCVDIDQVAKKYSLAGKELKVFKQGLVDINPVIFPDGRFVPRKSDLFG